MAHQTHVRAVSQHATVRCQQRGVTHALLQALLELADQSRPARRGYEVIYLSRGEANRLRKAGTVSPAILERLVGLA